MIERLRTSVALLRPRHLARLAARVTRLTDEHARLARWTRGKLARTHARTEHLTTDLAHAQTTARALAATLADTASAVGTLTAHVADLQRQVRELSGRVGAVETRADDLALRDQMLAVSAERLATDHDRDAALVRALDGTRVRMHVTDALRRSPLELHPFPHMVIDGFLPDDVYATLIETMPPRVLFEDLPVNKQQMKVPPRLAGAATFQLWRFLVKEIVEGELQPQLVERFRVPIMEFTNRFWPGLSLDDVRFKGSDGRIILRRRGYEIPPHRDPKWGWLTFILYLPKPGDPDTWGTQLYHVTNDTEAPGAQPFWMQGHNNVLAKDVRFVPNRALVFLNSDGSHGASLPDEAPADFERYIYQCRIGPDRSTIDRLKARLTPEALERWEGKQGY